MLIGEEYRPLHSSSITRRDLEEAAKKDASVMQSETLHMHAGALHKYYLLIQGGVYT